MVDMTLDEAVRFESIWLKEDLLQLEIEDRLSETETFINLPPITEATPVGIRAISGTEFGQDLISTNVTWIPEFTAIFMFHKVVRFGAESLASIFRNGLYPNCNRRHESFMFGGVPFPNSWIRAVKDPGKLKFVCWWSNITVDMGKPYVYQPNTNGTWLFLDLRVMIEARIGVYWQMTGGFGTTKDMVPPWFIVATYDEAANTLHIRDPDRFEVIIS